MYYYYEIVVQTNTLSLDSCSGELDASIHVDMARDIAALKTAKTSMR